MKTAFKTLGLAILTGAGTVIGSTLIHDIFPNGFKAFIQKQRSKCKKCSIETDR